MASRRVALLMERESSLALRAGDMVGSTAVSDDCAELGEVDALR